MPEAGNRRGGVTGVASSLGREIVEDALLLIRGGQRSAIEALGHGLLEDLLSSRDQVKEDGGTASALSVNGNHVGVTAEVVDVLLHPLQGLNLVQETGIVIRNSPTGEVRVGKESESRQTVVDRDDDDLLTLVDPVIVGQSGRISEDIAPSVDVEHHRHCGRRGV